MKKAKKKKSKLPCSHHGWAVFRDGIPNFMSTAPIEATNSKNRALVILEQFKIIFPHSKLRIGKVSIQEGWL